MLLRVQDLDSYFFSFAFGKEIVAQSYEIGRGESGLHSGLPFRNRGAEGAKQQGVSVKSLIVMIL